jgi:hypothetical protein
MADRSDDVAKASRAVAEAMTLCATMDAKTSQMRQSFEALHRQWNELATMRSEAVRQLDNLEELASRLRRETGAARPSRPHLQGPKRPRHSAGTSGEVKAMAKLLTERNKDNLGELMSVLAAHGIHSGVHTSPLGTMVWIADRDYRRREDRLIRRTVIGRWPNRAATEWLHAAALRLFPNGDYAQRHRTMASTLARAADD